MNVLCDIPDTDKPTVTLKAITSTNGSDLSNTRSVQLVLAPAGVVPSVTALSLGSVSAGSEVAFDIQGMGIGAFNGDGRVVTWEGINLKCDSLVLNLNADNTQGRITGCKAPDMPGTGPLRWYYDLDRRHVAFGVLNVSP